MFHRIIHENWVTVVPIIAFLLTFTVFIGVLIRTVVMKKEKRVHLASLPLDDPQNPNESKNTISTSQQPQQ